MSLFIGGSQDGDNSFLDDILIKEGSLGAFEERINNESPTDWYDGWANAEPVSTFTVDVDDWRIHYRNRYPLTFMHDRKFVFGVRHSPSIVHIDQYNENTLWAQ